MPEVAGTVGHLQHCHDYRRQLGRYAREVPKEKNMTGKIFMQRIERNSLTLSTRIKRLTRITIRFSHPVEIHEKVIGSFIEKHIFY